MRRFLNSWTPDKTLAISRTSIYRMNAYGPAARHLGYARAKNAGSGTASWLRARQGPPTDVPRRVACRIRVALPSVEETRTQGLDLRQMGNVRAKSTRQGLQ